MGVEITMKKVLFALTTALILTGCATTSGLDAKTQVSSFDGSKSVAIAPHGFACVNYLTCATTGFSWNNKRPEQASMLVEILDPVKGGDYHAIAAVKINIDGEIITLTPAVGDTNNFDYDDIYKKTSRLYTMPLPLLERIKQSNITKMQVIAKDALIEGDFKNTGESTKSYHAMLRFLDQVKAAKAS